MTEDLDTRYRRVLAKQLTMNQDTWRALQSRGLTESTEVRLDFAYDAPDKAAAARLKSVLEDETDYSVTVSASGLVRKQWTVSGSTQLTAISPAILDQWVDWMVTAGLHQNCEFDGWGTQLCYLDRVT